MTTEGTHHVESIENPSSLDQKKIISRLILQKVMSSDSVKFLTEQHFKSLNTAFLSEEPDRDFTVEYRIPGARDAYYSGIASATIKWEESKGELQDLEGNVWVTYQLKISPSISSAYTTNYETFLVRAEALNSIAELLRDIVEMVPGPIRVRHLDNEQRLARDKKRKYDATCKFFFDLVSSREHRHLRTGLRRGGRGRTINRELVAGHEPGNYSFQVDDGSRRRPNVKKYVMTIPENPNYYAYLKRSA